MIRRFTTDELNRSAAAVYLACEASVADDISAKLRQAAQDALVLTKAREYLVVAGKFAKIADLRLLLGGEAVS